MVSTSKQMNNINTFYSEREGVLGLNEAEGKMMGWQRGQFITAGNIIGVDRRNGVRIQLILYNNSLEEGGEGEKIQKGVRCAHHIYLGTDYRTNNKFSFRNEHFYGSGRNDPIVWCLF